ncbi:hypothetical protein H2200_007142 [Cladophialophora chaetospira]|uniref:Uncharacterized protein n=1 Tax=Cladophialophora chaetospira TaxID=386627 RepID=A0AA38X7C0_9EURO|nr:hypothetical protein H2200_007142 [Cladophialophora chaetospira]
MAISSVIYQQEMVLSVFKPPVFLAGGEPIEKATQHLLSRPTLPARFSCSREMHHAFFEIFRWRYLHEFMHQGEEWTPKCTAFRQLESLILEWYSLAGDYMHDLKVNKKAQQPSLDSWGSCLPEVQRAAGQLAYVRRMYTALHYSVIPIDSKVTRGAQRPLRPNFVNLSDPDKVVIFIPVVESPVSNVQHEVEVWQGAANAGGSHKRPVVSWAQEVSLVYSSSGKPAYVQLTNYKSLW